MALSATLMTESAPPETSNQNEEGEKEKWPDDSFLGKDFNVSESKLTNKEKKQYPDLFRIESGLLYLSKWSPLFSNGVSKEIEKMRLNRNLNSKKINAFAERCRQCFEFFKCSTQIIDVLENIFFGPQEKNKFDAYKFHFTFNYNNFKNSLTKMMDYYQTHIFIKLSNQSLNAKLLYNHLLKFKNQFEETNALFAETLGPLKLCFSIKLNPIIEQREAFFVAQMMNVAERGAKISQIRQEMQEMTERRQRLEQGTVNLDRMFGILLKFKDSLKLEDDKLLSSIA